MNKDHKKLFMTGIKESNKDLEEKKKYIGVLVSEFTRQKWKTFTKENDFPTTSNLIRRAVNLFIQLYQKIKFLENLSKISYEFKKPLTSIKGFAQLLIEEHKEELSWAALVKVKEIIDNSLILENKIKEILENTPTNQDQYEILIVDDDKSTINLLRNFFESRGYMCKEAKLGVEALEFSLLFKPKIILLDILLPDKDGYDICKTLKFNKEYEELKDIPIYFITAVTKVEVDKHLKETGANGYFLKPFNFSDFRILFNYL